MNLPRNHQHRGLPMDLTLIRCVSLPLFTAGFSKSHFDKAFYLFFQAKCWLECLIHFTAQCTPLAWNYFRNKAFSSYTVRTFSLPLYGTSSLSIYSTTTAVLLCGVAWDTVYARWRMKVNEVVVTCCNLLHQCLRPNYFLCLFFGIYANIQGI